MNQESGISNQESGVLASVYTGASMVQDRCKTGARLVLAAPVPAVLMSSDSSSFFFIFLSPSSIFLDFFGLQLELLWSYSGAVLEVHWSSILAEFKTRRNVLRRFVYHPQRTPVYSFAMRNIVILHHACKSAIAHWCDDDMMMVK